MRMDHNHGDNFFINSNTAPSRCKHRNRILVYCEAWDWSKLGIIWCIFVGNAFFIAQGKNFWVNLLVLRFLVVQIWYEPKIRSMCQKRQKCRFFRNDRVWKHRKILVRRDRSYSRSIRRVILSPPETEKHEISGVKLKWSRISRHTFSRLKNVLFFRIWE